MIELTPADVAEFRQLYRRETGRDISDAQARDYAERVIRLAAFLAGIDLSGLPPGETGRRRGATGHGPAPSQFHLPRRAGTSHPFLPPL